MTTNRFPFAYLAVLACASAAPLLARAQQVVDAASAVPAARDPETASRVSRDAVNPMRVIIEAGKIKARTKTEGDPVVDPPAPEKKPVRVAPPVAAAPKPAPAKPAATAAAKPAAGNAANLPSPAALEQVPPLSGSRDITTVELASKADLRASEPAPIPLPPVALKLAKMVEPFIPESARRRLRVDSQVVVGFTVKPDGSVTNVVVQSNPIKGLDPHVIEAVSQWRYEPIPESREHTVQLLFRVNND